MPIPDAISDDHAILMSNIPPTGWFDANLAGIEKGDHETVRI